MLGIPVTDGLVLALCPFTGSIRDFSGAGRHPTQAGSGLYWGARGGCDGLVSNGTGHLVVANDATLEAITDLTIFVGGAGGDGVIMGKADGGGVQFDLSAAGDVLTLSDGSGVTATLPGLGNADSFAVTLASGGVAAAHIPGASPVAFSGTTTITANDAAITLLNYFTGAFPWRVPSKLVLLYSRELTTAEIAKLHAYSQARITPRRQWPGSGLRYPGRETNRVTPTPAGAWTANGTNVVSDITDGIKVEYVATANPAVTQVALVNGTQYEIRGEVISDGAHVFNVTDNGATTFGTMMTSTAWQDFLFIGRASASSLILQGMAITTDFSVRNLKVWTRPPGYTHRTGDPLFLDNIQTARITLADQASGRLSNTPYQIESGTWALREDAATGERYIECIAAGPMSRRNLIANDTTWEMVVQTPGTGNLNIGIVASVAAAPDDAAQNGYNLLLASTEEIRLQRSTAGGQANLFRSTASYFSPNTEYTIRVTRSGGNVFTAYIRGGAFVAWTLIDSSVVGSNPVTDANHTASLYVVHDYDAGHRLYSDRQFAGVLAPV